VNGSAGDLLQRFSFLQEKNKKEMNICVVGLNSIFCKAFFSDQIMKKDLFCRNKLLWEGFSGDGRV